jgi:glycosyltransferase involved in cell wall biosynthesis
MISVLVPTKNRPISVKECLHALLLNTYQNFEAIVIDQSSGEETRKAVLSFRSTKIKYVHIKEKGRSRALNCGISHSTGEIIAFLDDDCIVSLNWLQEMNSSYRKNPDISAVFGNVYPYQERKHQNKICPSIFSIQNLTITKNPVLHFLSIGMGNNMSIRRPVTELVGYFKNWLGAGTFARAGEDGEYIFRMLLQRQVLLTNPEIVMYHNRWISSKENQLLLASYTRGSFAFYGYYLFTKSHSIMCKFLLSEIKEIFVLPIQEWSDFRIDIQDLPDGLTRGKRTLFFIKSIIQKGYGYVIAGVNMCIGLGIGIFYSIYEGRH